MLKKQRGRFFNLPLRNPISIILSKSNLKKLSFAVWQNINVAEFENICVHSSWLKKVFSTILCDHHHERLGYNLWLKIFKPRLKYITNPAF